MYERNAIVIDRYFANMFGYELTNNIKNNSNNYFELVGNLEKYQESSEKENNIMQEFEKTATQIKETQKLQETLNKRNLKYNESIKNLFENLDEEPETLNKKFEKLDEEIIKNNEEIRINAGKFVEEIREFNEKSEKRNNCGRERRLVENDYQTILNSTTDNFNKINKEKLREIKTFLKSDNKNETKKEIKEKILKNGSKEKVPFDENVITTAIDVSTDIEQKRAEILLSIYDKTTKILDEIKNDTVKIEKHKKNVKDSSSKLEFLNAISEYIVLFLDNERMNTIGGEEEHKKIMGDACENLQQDLVQIQNMYSLLIKEITGKSSKKAYKELYNPEYLLDLQDDERKFERSISQLNMMGTVIYPDYWRVEGMQKIYDTFKDILTETYEKDLSEYEPIDIAFDVNEEMLEEDEIEDNNEEIKEDVEKNNDTTNDEEESEIEEDVVYDDDLEENIESDSDLDETQENDEEDEFFWDDDDENDELNFGSNNYILDDDENEEENEDIEEETIEDKEEKREKEIDEILGFFDEEDTSEEDEDILDEIEEQDNEEEKTGNMDLSGKIFDDEEDEKEKGRHKEKRRSLFGRRKK